MRLPRALVITDLGRPFESVEYLLVLILALSIYGEAFPYGLPLILPVTLAGFLWFGVIKRRLSLPLNAGFALVAVCFSFYLIGIIRTAYVYDTNSRDLRNAVAVLLFGALLFSIRNLSEFRSFRDKAETVGVFAGTGLAIIGLYKFHKMTNGQNLPLLWVGGYVYPWGTSLIADYNFYAFAMLCGAISCLFCLFRFSSFPSKVMCIIAFCLNAFSLALSGSRRGWVTETLLLIAVLLLTARWLLSNVLQFGSSMFASKQALKIIAAFLTVAVIGPIFISRYGPGFLDSNHGSLQSEIKDLQFRFSTLGDPGESFGSRISRWRFAGQLLDQAPLYNLLFGEGFDYLRFFASSFDVVQKDSSGTTHGEDYPHNPVISAALYSGVIGSFAVTLFIVLALLRYLKERKTDTYFLVLYFASLWFILPAFDSIFSGKFFGFLLLIPWSMPQGPASASDGKVSIIRDHRGP